MVLSSETHRSGFVRVFGPDVSEERQVTVVDPQTGKWYLRTFAHVQLFPTSSSQRVQTGLTCCLFLDLVRAPYPHLLVHTFLDCGDSLSLRFMKGRGPSSDRSHRTVIPPVDSGVQVRVPRATVDGHQALTRY